MKVRGGFVSNSSSSSFLILAKSEEYEFRGSLERLLSAYTSISGEVANVEECFDYGGIVSGEEYRSYIEKYNSGKWFDDELGRIKDKEKYHLVNSREDNSIPWAIQEFLCDIDGTIRFHFG